MNDQDAARALAAWVRDPLDLDALIELDEIARHPGTDATLRARLARADLEWPEHATASWIVRAAAMSGALTGALRAGLAAHARPWVRHGVAVATSTPGRLLARLAVDDDPEIRAAVARHPSCPRTQLAALAEDREPEVRAAVARNARTPVALLIRLSCDRNYRVMGPAAHHPRLPSVARVTARLSPLRVIDEATVAALNAASDQGGFEDWGDAPSPWEQRYMRETTPQLRRCYVRRPTVRALVAAKDFFTPGYPVPLLATKLDDPHDDVSREIAANPWIDEAMLSRMASHASSYTRDRVAQHRATPPAVRAMLLGDPVVEVRRTAIVHSPDLDLSRYAASGEELERRGVAYHPHAPAELLERLALDPEWSVRIAVAANPAAPGHVIERLSSDEVPGVRLWVAQHEAVGAAIIQRLFTTDPDAGVRAAATWRSFRDRMLEHRDRPGGS